MAISSGDVFVKLINGEKIQCQSCGKGFYKALTENYRNCCHFVCTECGDAVIGVKKLRI